MVVLPLLRFAWPTLVPRPPIKVAEGRDDPAEQREPGGLIASVELDDHAADAAKSLHGQPGVWHGDHLLLYVTP
jgi:hypothetical protein